MESDDGPLSHAHWVLGCEIERHQNKIKILEEQIEKLKEEMGEPAYDFGLRVSAILEDNDYYPSSYGEASRFIKDIIEENEKLKNTIENLKKHYDTDLMEWKGKHQSLQDMLDLYIEASN